MMIMSMLSVCFCLKTYCNDNIQLGFVGVLTIALVGLCFLSWVISTPLSSFNNGFLKGLGTIIRMSYSIVLAVCYFIPYFIKYISSATNDKLEPYYEPVLLLIDLLIMSIILKRIVGVVKIDTKRNRDSYNHKYQSFNLMAAGFYIVYIIVHFNITDKSFLPFGLCAALLGLIFNDSIKGMVAYFHLHSNDLLHIGDWIEVPSQYINGEIVNISLVTVSVKNWDNTISNISITSLLNGSFKNNQSMLDNESDGRRILRSFIIDTRSIRNMSVDEKSELEKKLNEQGEINGSFELIASGGDLSHNLYLYREYLHNWIVNNKAISQNPLPIVRLLEPVPEGVPIQIYAFVSGKKDIVHFEEVQFALTEHVLYSLEWFGLKIYQQTSIDNISINLEK